MEVFGKVPLLAFAHLPGQREGLNPPAKVQADTQLYRKEQDVIGQFISECCQTGKDSMQCRASQLCTLPDRQWAEASDSPMLSQKHFGTYLTLHGSPRITTPMGTTLGRKLPSWAMVQTSRSTTSVLPFMLPFVMNR